MKKMFKKALALIITLVLLFATVSSAVLTIDVQAANNVPADAVEFNGHYYKIIKGSCDWTSANAKCVAQGGYLATITSAEEQEIVEELLAKDGYGHSYWLGASVISGEIYWITGEYSEFVKWSKDQPDNINGAQKYLRIYGRKDLFGEWDDFENSSSCMVGAVCEWESPGYEIYGRVFDENLDYYVQNLSSSTYDPTLANMMAALSKAVYSEDDINSACESLGFEAYGVYDHYSNYNPHTCGYSLAFKKSDYSDDIICLVSVRGTQGLDYNADWIGNFELITDSDDKHIGFSYPANRIYETIQKVIGDKDLNVKYFITGHSRGGAVGNLLSVKLMENGVSEADIYNYNFACPDVANKMIFEKYDNIFNLCNREDIVPYVPGNTVSFIDKGDIGKLWGKFGQTYWFTEDDPDTVNPFADHDMDLYLEFFDQQLAPSKWGYSFADALDDSAHLVFGWIARFRCPVDVEITDKNGNKIASVIGGKINYYDSEVGDVIIFTEGDKKGVFVKGDKDFNINLIGTDTGEMEYSIEKCELKTGEIFESKTFENVTLEKGKTMYSPVSEAESVEDINLFVTENENGETKYTYVIKEDGTEKKYNYVPDCEVTIVNNPGTKTIKYGETLKLTANYKNKPDGAVVCWYVDGVMQSTGDTFELTFESGTKTVEVRLTDAEGNPYTDVAGDDIVDSEKVTVNDGFFQKLISFFKNLFGMDRTVVQ